MKKTKKRGPDYRGIALNLYNQKYNKSSYQDGTTILPGQGERSMQGMRGMESKQSLYDQYIAAGMEIPFGYADASDEQIEMMFGQQYRQLTQPTPPPLGPPTGPPTGPNNPFDIRHGNIGNDPNVGLFNINTNEPIPPGPPSRAYGDRLDIKQRQAKQQMYFGPRAPKIPDNFYTAMYGSKVPGYKPGDVVTGKDAGVNKNIDPSLEGLHPDELTVINREKGEIVERQLPNLDEGDPGNYFVYEGNTHDDVRNGMPNGGNDSIEQIGAFITPKKYSNQMEKIVINRKENKDILKTFV